MELPIVTYNKENILETASGNKVSTKSVLCGTDNIVLLGKAIILDDAILRGDLGSLRVGRYSIIKERVVVRPSYKKFSKGITYMPLHIGEYVIVEEDTVLCAAAIGSFVHVGQNCVIGRRSVLKDCCAVADNAVLPPETTVPPFAIVAGNPAKIVGELPECTQDLMIDTCRSFYQNFIPEESSKPGASFILKRTP